jgi:hypothetical protein
VIFRVYVNLLEGKSEGIQKLTITTGWWLLLTPLKNDGLRQFGMIIIPNMMEKTNKHVPNQQPAIYEKIKHVPNHRPDNVRYSP